jgi:DNA-binding transcriptional LysR family regulator
MELMQLEMFVAVVEERSIQGAADRVSRTQPAVSIARRKLEDQAGTTLLDRSRRGTYRLTAAGEFLYECASRMVAMREEAKSMLRGKQHNCAGRLSIGASGSKTSECAAKLTTKFCASRPMVRIELFSDEPERLLSEVADQKLDAAFFSTHPAQNQTGPSLVLNPLRGCGDGATMWLAVPRAGRSHTLRLFEEMVYAEPPHVTRTTTNRPTRYASPVLRKRGMGMAYTSTLARK